MLPIKKMILGTKAVIQLLTRNPKTWIANQVAYHKPLALRTCMTGLKWPIYSIRGKFLKNSRQLQTQLSTTTFLCDSEKSSTKSTSPTTSNT